MFYAAVLDVRYDADAVGGAQQDSPRMFGYYMNTAA